MGSTSFAGQHTTYLRVPERSTSISSLPYLTHLSFSGTIIIVVVVVVIIPRQTLAFYYHMSHSQKFAYVTFIINIFSFIISLLA